jgi:hypothetical protein
MSESENKSGWICCCKGRIVDSRNPAASMVCCRNYEWFGEGKPNEYPRDKK